MSKLFTTLLLLISLTASAQTKLLTTDLNPLSGKWTGSITYLDYTTNKPFSMPADLEIKRIAGSNDFQFMHAYPKEASANSTDTLVISDDGLTIDAEPVISKKKAANGNREIITQSEGRDGNENKEALIRHTYVIGENVFEIKKEVQFKGTKEWILRHTYSYTKVR